MDPAQVADVLEARADHLVVARTPRGQPAVYHAGSGWDRSGHVRVVEDWDRHLDAFVRRLRSPLVVEVAPR
jgi:alpha-beta hydrolase superfamily lysophospholipase